MFAVAITLLVLDVRRPYVGASDSRALWLQLEKLGPNIAAHVHLRLAVLLYWLNLVALAGALAWMVVHVGGELV